MKRQEILLVFAILHFGRRNNFFALGLLSPRTVAPCALVFALVAIPGILRAEIIDMRAAVVAHPNLATHYTFEGETTIERQADKARNNARPLTAQAFGSGSVDGIEYLPGFDATSAAFQPHYINNWNGAGLGGSPYHFPASGFTVEMLVRPGPTNALGMAFMGPVWPNRGYPLFQVDGHLQLAAGNAAWSLDGARRNVVANYAPDHWYYVAVNMKHSGGNTLANAYAANLTAGETTLTQTLENELIPGTYSLNGTDFAVGRSLFNQEPFFGMIDELAIYTAVLPQNTLQGHLSQLWIPEPASAVSTCMALCLLLLWRRQKNRRPL